MYQRGSSTFITGSAPILPPDAYFFTIRAAGSQVGVSSITVDTLPDGVQVTERIGLDLPLHPTSPRASYTNQFTIGLDLRLREFRITLPGASGPVIQQGHVEGDSVIVITPGTGEPSWRLDARDYSLLPPLAAPVALARQQGLRQGVTGEFPVFDPVTLSRGTISLSVVDDSTFLVPDSADFDSIGGLWIPAHSDTLAAWRLDWSDGHRTAELWVDSRGLPIRVTSPAGFSLDRSAFEIVNINYRRQREDRPALRPGSVIPETSIAAGATPDSGVGSMRVRLSALRQPVAIPADSPASLTHSMEDGDLVVRRVAPDSTATAPDSVLAPWLGDAPLLGIGDTALARQARRIIGDASTPGSKARRLVAWVSRTIRRAPDLNLPRAATVLREGQADVDGHTLLFVALARGSGIPARPVSGILLAGGRFYLHSWAEVYAGGWVAVDPTWGEFPAGANRVGMARGLLARPLDLLPLVGGLDAELITFTQGP